MRRWNGDGNAAPAWIGSGLVRPVPALAGGEARGDLLRFDASNYRPEREEQEPVPRTSPRDEKVVLTFVVVTLVLAMLMPISAAALVDLVRYLFG